MKTHSRKQRAALGIALVVSFCVLGFWQLGAFTSWQTALTDRLFFHQRPHPNIVIIAVDNASLQKIGRWPWPRSTHAKLLDTLSTYPAAIGFDILFSQPSDASNDTRLAEAINKSGRVILPVTAGKLSLKKTDVQVSQLNYPLPDFAKAAAGTGLINVLYDTDGIVRRTPLRIRTPAGQAIDSFAVALLKQYYKQPFATLDVTLPSLTDFPIADGVVRLNFIGKPGTFPFYSYHEVLSGKVNPEIFKGKIVIIGTTAQGLYDSHLTATSTTAEMSGIEIHATLMQTILQSSYLTDESASITISILMILCLLLGQIFVLTPIVIATMAFIATYFMYFIFAIISFDQGIVRNLLLTPVALALEYTVLAVSFYVITDKRKEYIKRVLSYYISKPIAEEVLSDPKKLSLGGSNREVSILFSDIAGFSTISEKLDPDKLAPLVNAYLTQMTQIVEKHRGVLDRYIGDAVVAIWGAPRAEKQHALLACRTALEMQAQIKHVKQDWAKLGVADDFHVRIGINTGEVVVGNMGSDTRFTYSMIGDNANLAARLESINKQYGTSIVMSQATYDYVKNEVIARCIDVVAVKGKTRSVVIYELRGLGAASGVELLFLDTFASGRDLYMRGSFAKALKAFRQLAMYDPVSAVYVARCQDLMLHPPAEWDGVFHATTK